jgi:hypothetical protein
MATTIVDFGFIWDWSHNFAVSFEIDRPGDRPYHIAMIGCQIIQMISADIRPNAVKSLTP